MTGTGNKSNSEWHTEECHFKGFVCSPDTGEKMKEKQYFTSLLGHALGHRKPKSVLYKPASLTQSRSTKFCRKSFWRMSKDSCEQESHILWK